MEIQRDREGTIFPTNRVPHFSSFQTNISLFFFFRRTLRSKLNKISWNIIPRTRNRRGRVARSVQGRRTCRVYIYPVIDAACALSCRRRDSSGRESAGREANVLETEAILAYPRRIVAHVAGKGAVANRAVAMTLSLFH